MRRCFWRTIGRPGHIASGSDFSVSISVPVPVHHRRVQRLEALELAGAVVAAVERAADGELGDLLGEGLLRAILAAVGGEHVAACQLPATAELVAA